MKMTSAKARFKGRCLGGSSRMGVLVLGASLSVSCTMMPVENQVSVGVSGDGSPEVLQMTPEESAAWKTGIHKVIQAHATELKWCWDELRRTHAEAEGKVVVEWQINVAGKAENVRLTDTDPLMDGLQPCLAKRFGEWTFPTSPKPVVADVKYPLRFSKSAF